MQVENKCVSQNQCSSSGLEIRLLEKLCGPQKQLVHSIASSWLALNHPCCIARSKADSSANPCESLLS